MLGQQRESEPHFTAMILQVIGILVPPVLTRQTYAVYGDADRRRIAWT